MAITYLEDMAQGTGKPRRVDPFRVAQGALIEDSRKKAGLTQTQLAEEIGVDQAHVSAIEHGRRGASPQLLARIAAALPGTTVDSFTPKELPPPGMSAPPQPESLPEGLAGFLERNREKERIDRREEWYLRESRFRHEPWVVFDDRFWLQMLKFWRWYLAEAAGVKQPPLPPLR